LAQRYESQAVGFLKIKNQARIDIGVEFIKLESPIKEIGEHKVKVEIGKNRGEFVVVIEPTK
jgi:hypothetical protein